MPFYPGGFGALFVIVPVFIGLCFVLVMGAIVFAVVKGIGQTSYNNAQPVQSVPAKVVAKRANTWGMNGANTGGSVNTSYYVTFEMADGGRQELGMGGHEYGLLVEGDRGTLSFQGTRYKGFDRSRA